MDVTGSNSFEVATSLFNIGTIHYLLQLYTPSLRFYQETLRISLTLFQDLHDAVNSNADIAEAAGRFSSHFATSPRDLLCRHF
jgi:hypothetical protein